MTPSTSVESEPARRVSVLSRLVPIFSFAAPAPACVIGAVSLFRLMRGFQNAEASGIASVAGGLAEANFPVSIALVFAIAVGFVGIMVTAFRLFASPTTAPPSALFFLVCGWIGFAPLLLFWNAERLLIQGVIAGGNGVVAGESSIRQLLVMTIITSALADILLVIATIVPLPAAFRAKSRYASVVAVVLLEVGLIAMAVAFQTRASWLQQIRFAGTL